MEKHLLEKYNDNPQLRALISLVPNIGGALDILLSEKGSKWREERLHKLLKELDAKIDLVKSDKYFADKMKERLVSEEFYDLLVQSMNSAIKTRQSQKIELYANILLNHIINANNENYSSELVIAILDSLTIDEITYLSELHKNKDKIELYVINGTKIHKEKYQNWITEHRKIANCSEELPSECKFPFNIELIWKLLTDKNIIDTVNDNRLGSFSYSYGDKWLNKSGQIQYSEKIIYSISDFGQEFINWILLKQREFDISFRIKIVALSQLFLHE